MFGMDFNKSLSIVTMAGIIGLVVLNYQGATAVFKSIADGTTQYVKTVQGR